MAEIAVHKPKNSAHWAWIIFGLVVLAWLIYALAPSYGMWQTRSRLADPITDVEMILAVPDHEALVGKNVALDGVRVMEVTGDRTFWIVSGTSAPLLVVLDEQPTTSGPVEGRYNVEAGQVLDVVGTIRRFPGWEEARSRWKLDPSRPVEAQRIYVAAEQLTITNRRDR